jgi:hypothetical protein
MTEITRSPSLRMSIRRTKPVCYLLILAIGLMTSFAFASYDAQHGHYMAAGLSVDFAACDRCDPDADSCCEDDGCPSPLHACGAKTGVSSIPVELSREYRRSVRFIDHPAETDRYRSRRADSIYRPPIA